jgi:hypothetical protein
MKTIHTVTQPIQFPQFWNEEWLKITIDELDSRKMTPDERASFEILVARNALAVKNENKKIAEIRLADKIQIVQNLISQTDFDLEKIAKIADVTLDFVKNIQEKLNSEK